MRTYLAAALTASLLLTGSAAAFAAQGSKAATHTKAAVDRTAVGTVKSIDATKLVVKTKSGEMTFSLGSTKPENITAGSTVQVHYKSEGKNRVATSVMLETSSSTKR